MSSVIQICLFFMSASESTVKWRLVWGLGWLSHVSASVIPDSSSHLNYENPNSLTALVLNTFSPSQGLFYTQQHSTSALVNVQL